MTFYSEPNGETMPCQCCMQSNDLEKVPTHLMSDVYTLGFEPIFVRRSITIQNNVLDVHLNTLFQQAHEICRVTTVSTRRNKIRNQRSGCYSPWAQRGHHAPLRTFWERYNIVNWSPCLRIKMLTLDSLVPTRNFGWFSRWPPWKKTKRLYCVTSASYYLLCLLL